MKRILPFLFVAVLTTPFWDLGHPLWEVDDARYAEVPREMHESGNWLTPSLNYVDYIEKPPFIYWLGAASYRIFGVSEAAARIPLACLALLGILGAWWLGSWLYSPRVGLYAGILLGTCVQFFALGHVITPDMAVSVALLWATALILRCLRQPKDRWAGALAWIAITAAFLSKGLISVLFPGLWTMALLYFFPDLRRGLRPLICNWGLPVFLAIIGAWFLAMEKANPGFFHVFVIEQHFQRFLDTQKYNRPGPWYYFFGVDFVGTLPWTPLLILALIKPLLHWAKTDARDRQLALWVLLIFSFFTLSSSKLITYILPLFAHQAVLGAHLLTRLRFDMRAKRNIKRFTLALGALFGAAIFALWIVIPHIKLPFALPSGLVMTAAVLLFSLCVAQYALNAFLTTRVNRAVIITATAALVAFLCLIQGTGHLEPQLSVRRMGETLKARIEALPAGTDVRLIAFDRYLHGIPFYTGRPVDVVNWVGELHYAKRFPRFEHRFGDEDTIRALPDITRRTYVTVRNREMEYFSDIAQMEKMRRRDVFGPWTLVEF